MVNVILTVIGVVLFLFAAFGAAFMDLNLLALGLVFFAASFIPFNRGNPPNA